MANCSDSRGTITMDRNFYENHLEEIEKAWKGYSYYGIDWDDVEINEKTVDINFYGVGRWSMASTLNWVFWERASEELLKTFEQEKPVLIVDYEDMEEGIGFYYHAKARVYLSRKEVVEYGYDKYEFGTREMYENFGYDYDEIMRQREELL